MKILIADDEIHMSNILKIYFEKEGFEVLVANDGEKALELFYDNKISLCVLDWMMPKKDGTEVCREIKAINNTKVMMLTAKGEADDEFTALELGADDYIKKPFDPRILMLRAKKLLDIGKIMRFEDFKLDITSKKLFRGEEDLNLTRREYDLMECFYKNKGKILSRDQLLDIVWGMDYYGEYRTVDTHIHRLRDKIGSEYIKTYRGMGYCFDYKN